MKRFLASLIVLLPFTAFAQSGAPDTAQTSKQEILNGVVVTASGIRQRQHVESTQMGRIDIPVAMLLKTPAIGGEADIIKALQLTPGVKRGTEGGIGMYVRGGGNDENLILLDGAPVYNAGHLLGFFSVFNAVSLKEVQLYKSSFPAQYGGRLSSVLDVKTKEGSLEDFKASGSLGLISSSLSVSGPIVKGRLAGIVSARRTYIDKVFRYIPYHFYDVNAKLTYVANSANRIYLSTYTGDDLMRMSSEGTDSAGEDYSLKSGMKLGNTTATLRWNNVSREGRVVSDISVLYTRFRYSVDGALGANALSVRSAISDIGLKGDFRWRTDGSHKITSGFSFVNHYFRPNIVQSSGSALDQFRNSEGKQILNTETGVYVADEWTLNSRWLINAGLRISQDFAGEKEYVAAEPRLAARYLLNEASSFKMSYARMAQYMHLVSSSSLTLPTDLWYPVTASIKPGLSDQVSAGYYHSFSSCGVSLSGEVYYKWLHNLIEYREGAQLILNDDFEKEMVQGKGRSYGLEVFATKTSGRLTGWVGYSLSYAHRQFDSLNKGKEYFARYDRRHDFSLAAMYDFNKRWGISTTVVYATGSPFTGQVGQYVAPKPDNTGFETLPIWSDRNALRLSHSFRIDLDVKYGFAISKRIRGEAHLSMYNVLNRTQPGRVQRVWNEQTGSYGYQQKGLFGNITTASVNFNL